MITDSEEFIKVASILADSNIDDNNCKFITSIIIEQAERINNATQYIKSQEYEYDDGEERGKDCCCDGYKIIEILENKKEAKK